jgi:hypothetical protein
MPEIQAYFRSRVEVSVFSGNGVFILLAALLARFPYTVERATL